MNTFTCENHRRLFLHSCLLLIDLHLFLFLRETFIEREPGESANDRNDRAIRVAAKWYSQHLKTPESDTDGLRVVLLTNDQGNKQKAEESGLLVYKCKQCYFEEREYHLAH